MAARQEQLKRREQFDREAEGKKSDLKNLESRLSKREDTLDRKLDTLSVKEKHLDDLETRWSQRDKAMAAKEEQLDRGAATSSAIGCCRLTGLIAGAGQGNAAEAARGRMQAGMPAR